MRKFAGHAALAVAAFASIATSKPKWHLQANPPPTKIDDALGTLAVIDASQRPEEVYCVTTLHPYLPAALRTNVGTRYEYLCPPGAHFREVVIAGSPQRGCGKPETPDDAFVRFVELKPVKVWRAEATTTLDVITEDLGGGTSYASTPAEVDGAIISTIDVSLAPDADPMLGPPRVQALGVANRFDIGIDARDNAQHRAAIAVHAVGYGICEHDCTPGQITVARAK